MQRHASAPITAHQADIIGLPCTVEARYLARRILRDETASDADIALAIDTLANSSDWMDINLARIMREQRRKNAQISREEADRARREETFIDLARPLVEANFRLTRTVRTLNRALAICIGILLMVAIGAAAVTSANKAVAQAAEWRAGL